MAVWRIEVGDSDRVQYTDIPVHGTVSNPIKEDGGKKTTEEENIHEEKLGSTGLIYPTP